MKPGLALLVCLLIDGISLGRVLAQQPAPRSPGSLSIRSHDGYLGVGVKDIDDDQAKALKLPEVRGVEITHVEDGSPASKAGLLEGDVVLEFNGQRVDGAEQFTRMVRETASGHKITLQIMRNGATQTVTPVVGVRNPTAYSWTNRVMPGDGNSWNFTVPPMPAMPAMPGFGRQRGVVGIETQSLSGQLAEYFGVKEGVLIVSVVRNSPAEKAGLKAGDVVTKVNGESVATTSEVQSQVRNGNGKRMIPFAVMRNHREMSFQVAVGDEPDSEKGERL